MVFSSSAAHLLSGPRATRLFPAFYTGYGIPRKGRKGIYFDGIYSQLLPFWVGQQATASFATSSKNYYTILGVSKNASADEIKKAYKKMALKHHPDRNPKNRAEAENHFREIAEAYQTLSDPQKRSIYDAYGTETSRLYQHPGHTAQYDTAYSSGSQAGNFGGFNVHYMSQKEAEELFKHVFSGMGIFDMLNQAAAQQSQSRRSRAFNNTRMDDFGGAMNHIDMADLLRQFGGRPARSADSASGLSTAETSKESSIITKNGRLIERIVKRTRYTNGSTVEQVEEIDIGNAENRNVSARRRLRSPPDSPFDFLFGSSQNMNDFLHARNIDSTNIKNESGGTFNEMPRSGYKPTSSSPEPFSLINYAKKVWATSPFFIQLRKVALAIMMRHLLNSIKLLIRLLLKRR